MEIAAPSERSLSVRLPARRSAASDCAIDLDRAARILWAATALVFFAGLFRELWILGFGRKTALGKMPILDLNAEQCLPAWYASTLMAGAALLLFSHGWLSRRRGERGSAHWYALAAIFLYLSFDEAVGIHELLVQPLRTAFGATGVLHFAWVVAAAPLVFVGAVFFLPFVLRMPSPTRWWLILAGLIFVAGAIGMEMAGGYVKSVGGPASTYAAAVIAEEGLELLGLTLFVACLGRLFAERAPELRLRLGPGPEA